MSRQGSSTEAGARVDEDLPREQVHRPYKFTKLRFLNSSQIPELLDARDLGSGARVRPAI